MKVAVLFSGGKDSGLTTILLEPFFEELELVTFTFGGDDAWKVAADAAKHLGHPHRTVRFEDGVLEDAIDMLRADGYPKGALNYVHSIALESLSREYRYIADGTRRDDRAPVMSYEEVRSLEDRMGVRYIRPLAGWGYSTINEVSGRHMDFQVMNSDRYPAADFEVGLRYALAARFGQGEVGRIFPANHTHSRVVRRKKVE